MTIIEQYFLNSILITSILYIVSGHTMDTAMKEQTQSTKAEALLSLAKVCVEQEFLVVNILPSPV